MGTEMATQQGKSKAAGTILKRSTGRRRRNGYSFQDGRERKERAIQEKEGAKPFHLQIRGKKKM